MPQRDPEPEAPGRELHPGERIDGPDVGIPQPTHVADRDIGPAPLERAPEPIAELLDLGAIERLVDGHHDRGRLWRRSL